ncbi:hypothetical protein QTP86_003360 [Hemibagrus guttatus]|nr:hypothetical protein QTP86_003360 [Hemibagrus guttatus]
MITGRVQYLTDEQNHFSLRLSDVKKTDEHMYCFRITTNTEKERFLGYPGVTLTVTDLDLQIPPAEVTEGQSAVLTCKTTCSLTDPTFIWYKNSHHLTTKTSESNEVHLQSVSSEDAGSYSCAVRGYEHLRSPAQTLRVRYHPKNVSVSISPSDEIVEGSSVTLTCSSDANPPVKTYEWFKGMRLVGKEKTYTISKISSEDAGEYKCRCSNEVGHQDSNSVTLNVLYRPKNVSVSISPSGKIVEGKAVTLTCSSDANPPVKTYEWFKGATSVGNEKTYNISKISSEDSGEYKCNCSNEVGHQDSNSVTLNVLYPPKNISVSISPSAEIVEGSSLTMTCSSDANPPVKSYTWYKRVTSIGNEKTYTISKISSEDSGEYKCNCSNEVGHQDSNSISSATLTCSSDANPPLQNYTWFKEKESSPVGSVQSYRAVQSGQYYCEAQNKHGSERSAAVSVTVNDGFVIVYVTVGLGLFGLAAVLSAFFWLRSKRQKKKADEGDYQNTGPSAKDDTYAALDPAGRAADDVYHTLAVFCPLKILFLQQELLPLLDKGSRPGLTTTAIDAVDLQGAGGNWATVGRRSRGGRRVHRQREKRKGKSVGLRIGTLNVGTMTGKGRELADMMERRKVDILCVQETRWKGSKARSIGAGFKLFYYGVDSKRNGVGVVLKEEFVRNVLEVKRVSDRVMSLKLEFEGVMLNVVSGYAPQVGCELEEKERFWSELDEVMESIPTGERVVIGADFNGHVGEGNTGDEEVMGKFGVKERNLEGQMVVDFAKRMDMGVVNTYFQKREEHRVTYKTGGRRTQVDYILCRRGNLKEISDCKVVVGESVARQHRMVVCRMTLMVCKTKRSKIEKKTKWWKLKKEECCEEFRQNLRQALGGQVLLPDDWETTAEVIRETGRKVLGVSSGRRKEDKETWWWNEEVQDSIQRKRLAKKKWDMDRTEQNRQEYKELQRRVKREVSKAKQKAYEELYTRLDTRQGEKDLYRLARQRDRDGKDVQQVRVIKDRDGRVLTSEESVQRRWKEYFEELMNEENEREKRVEGVNSEEQKVDKIRKHEVRKALKRMKSGKAVGPDDIPVEVWKCLGEAAVEFLANLFKRVLESERMPEEWRRSVLVPIFKNKGDVQSCSNYRGIKLMSHTMKLWERVLEARLRKVVEI